MISKLGRLFHHPGPGKALPSAASGADSKAEAGGDKVHLSDDNRNFLTVSPSSEGPAIGAAVKATLPTLDIDYDKTRFQSTFVEQAAGKIEKKGGLFSPASTPEARTQQFLQAYRAAESLSPGLGAQVALQTVRELITPQDLAVFDRDVKGDLGGEIVRTETFQGLPLHEVKGGSKPGTSSPLAAYVTDKGLSQMETEFIKGHEISHVRHQDGIQSMAFHALDESLVEQNATLEEREKLFELGRDFNHLIELRCDRESLGSLLEAGHNPAAVRTLADSELFTKNPDGTYTHPPDALRRQQIEDMTGGQGYEPPRQG